MRGTGELPLDSLLGTHGVRFNLRASRGSKDKGGTPASASRLRAVWLGAKLTEKNGETIFTSVSNSGPAERGGIAPGDQAVAIDGLLLSAANADKRLRAYRPGDDVDITVFRGDELLTLQIKIEAAPQDTCFLELIDDVELEVESLRMAWLHG